MKNKKIPLGFTIVSFDVKSLFSSVPLTETIDFILDRVYNRKEISNVLTKNEVKKLLILCTKNVHFTLNNEIYVQNVGVAMGSTLGPILGNVFMVELENTLVPRLHEHVKKWRRFVDDTFAYVRNESTDYVLTTLNLFYPNTSFTLEKENNSQLPFLDVLFIRNGTHLDTTVYRKNTHNDLYLHWDAFTPVSWKRGTLRTQVNRAYLVCSNKELPHKGLAYLKSVFLKKNGYPLSTIKQLMKEIEEKQKQKEITQIGMTEQPSPQEQKVHSLLLLFLGPKCTAIVQNLNKTLKNVLPSNVKTQITYTGQTLNSSFQIKYKTNEKHKHDLSYYTKCPEASCSEEYLGETGRIIIERVSDHAGKDKQSHLLKHAVLRNQRHVELSNMKITDSSFHGNNFKRKMSEALYIKHY